MMRVFFVFTLVIFCFMSHTAAAQDTLPKFSVKNVGNNRVIIGWVNTYADLKQISIQRSFDSLKNYKTILSVTDPSAVQNGYADTKAPTDHMYYRIFYVMGNNTFYFTAAKQPVVDVSATNTQPALPPDTSTKVTTVVKKPDYVPSYFVYTNSDGNVFINLPDADKKNYTIKFFEEDNNYLFDVKGVKETGLTLDKTNFYHAGWFKFELYNDEKLVEKNKFYVPKSF